jgi:hypothetical protein
MSVLINWVVNYLKYFMLNRWVYKFIKWFFGSNFIDFLSFLRFEKSGRFVIFLTRFSSFSVQKCPIGIYRKTGPTKSTVLGPGPPPGKMMKFIDFSCFLSILGSSIEPEKPSVKSASTPYPPEKVTFMVILIICDPISTLGTIYHYHAIGIVCLSLSVFLFGR